MSTSKTLLFGIALLVLLGAMTLAKPRGDLNELMGEAEKIHDLIDELKQVQKKISWALQLLILFFFFLNQ